MEKVKVSKEVAEAFSDFMRECTKTDKAVIQFLALRESISWNSHLKTITFDEFLSMVVNGYEVEKTPEEKILEEYDKLYGEIYKYEPCTTQYSAAEASMKAIAFTLNTLGIKIEGVNA